MEKAFTEKEFLTNFNVCVKTVIKATWMFKLSLEFSGAAKQIINCIRFKQTHREQQQNSWP